MSEKQEFTLKIDLWRYDSFKEYRKKLIDLQYQWEPAPIADCILIHFCEQELQRLLSRGIKPELKQGFFKIFKRIQ